MFLYFEIACFFRIEPQLSNAKSAKTDIHQSLHAKENDARATWMCVCATKNNIRDVSGWLHSKISGWWLNQPIWKYARQNGFIFPNFRGEHKKYLKPPARLVEAKPMVFWLSFLFLNWTPSLCKKIQVRKKRAPWSESGLHVDLTEVGWDYYCWWKKSCSTWDVKKTCK